MEKIIIILALVIGLLFSISCETININENKTVAYISRNNESNYEKTFNELNLGKIFDYKYKLDNADKTWVRLWVEGYENGEKIDPNPLSSYNYYLNPNKNSEEGKLGFGIIDSSNKNSSIFFYSPSSTIHPIDLDFNFNENSNIYTWRNAINDETYKIKKGEEIILAVYREIKGNELVHYDYQKSDSIKKIISEDSKVLLFKFKIDDLSEME